MTKTKRPTLVEIAKLSGVTASTVSQVLTGNYGRNFSVRPQVRDRIMEVAKELNYRPNLAARSLSQRRTNLVSVAGSFYLMMGMELYKDAFSAIQQTLRTQKLDLLLTIPHQSQLSELPPWRVDAAIIVQDCQPGTIAELNQNGCPYVVLNGVMDGEAACVLADDEGGFAQAMDYLYGLGHKRIGYAQHRDANGPIHISHVVRHNAYLTQVAARGLPLISGHEQIDFSPSDYLKRAVLEEKATAIITYSHGEALDLLQAAMAIGISVPSQLSLICFNDVYPCAHVVPPLTSINLSMREMGQAAAEMLVQMLRGPCQQKQVRIRESLVPRSSTAAPPAA